MFQREVGRYIEEKQLLTRGGGVLVALSGGADSVALLRVLLALGYRCEAAHCNFCLREQESMRDEVFVRQICKQLEVPLQVVRFDTVDYAVVHHQSIEMAARELRYTWFEKVRAKRGLSAIAVAHHCDDSVETFLLNLLRGAGINGLKGITPRNGYVVRPLLEQSRASILNYLDTLQQSYVTDSSNLQDDYQRNKIRLHVLPLLASLNPSAVRSISEAASHLSEAALIYNKVIDETKSRLLHPAEASDGNSGEEAYRIDIAHLLKETSPTAVLFEVLHPLGFSSRQVGQVMRSLVSGQSGRWFFSAQWEVLRDRNALLIRSKVGRRDTQFDSDNDEIDLPQLNYRMVERTPSFEIPRDRNVACLDADRLTLPLTVRRWQAGDKFVPLGMAGKKNISDYLTDRKFSLFRKERQCVLCDAEGNIVWLVDERPDQRFRVTEQTTRLLLVEHKPIDSI